MSLRVCAVTVTYGDRFNYVSQLVDALVKEGVNKIIIVDNGSSESSRIKLEELTKRYQIIILIRSNENLGSAGGFHLGIKSALERTDCDFIWLLDDDNVPLPGALNELINYYQEKAKDHSNFVCLSSLRIPNDYHSLKRLIKKGKYEVNIETDSFLGFTFKKILKYFYKCFLLVGRKIICRKLSFRRSRKEHDNTFENTEFIQDDVRNLPVVRTTHAPYGGFFFHRSIVNIIGLPRKDYYLYADDTEWTYRISKNGGVIYILPRSLIKDLLPSWNRNQTNALLALLYAPADRLYYVVRNIIVFTEENCVRNRFIYKFNKVFFSLVIYIIMLAFDSNKAKMFRKALKDAKLKKMGKFDDLERK